MVFLGFVKKIWILEYLCHFIIRLHIKGRLLVKPLAIAHFSIQEYEFGVWYFSREFGCIVVRFARLKNSSILFLVCTLQTENVVIIPILFQTNGLFVLQLLILFFSIFVKKIEVKLRPLPFHGFRETALHYQIIKCKAHWLNVAL